MAGSGHGIHATELSLSILEYVSDAGNVTQSEIANEFDIANSTAHNHLRTLVNHRLLTKYGREYQLGIRNIHFGERARSQDPAYSLTQQTVQNLAQTTNSEADFLIEDGGRMLSIYDVMNGTMETDFTVGQYYYMHTSATGKATLATFSERKVNEVIDKWGLPQKTEHTITDRATLIEELDQIQRQGYAINDQEIVEGLYSIGKIIEEPNGDIFGSISVGGPTYRLNQDTIDTVVEVLEKAIEQLETEIENLRTTP